MPALQTLASILGLSFVAGINLYAAVLVVGLGIRYQWIQGLPAELHVLAHPAVLILAGVLYAVEFLADKIPFVTPIWDTIHTLVRPLGAAALALGAAGELHPMLQVVAALAGGSLALGTHSTKMGVRLLAHTAPEPVSHSAISVAEDVGAVSLLVLAYQYPYIALAVLAVLIAVVAMMLPFVLRTLRFLLAGFGGWFGALAPGKGGLPAVDWPGWLRSHLEGGGRGRRDVVPGYARSLGGVGRLKKVFLVREGADWVVHAKGFTSTKTHPVERADDLSAGIFYDVLAWTLPDGKLASVYLTQKWADRWRDMNRAAVEATDAGLPSLPTASTS